MFSSGRRMLALRKVESQARELGFRALVEHIKEALRYEVEVRDLERRWKHRDTRSSLAREIDILVDQTVTALRDSATSQSAGARPDDPIVGKVEAFVTALFPGGVKPITTLPFADELATVEDMVRALRGKLRATVEELGLTRLAQRLAELAVEYRAALETEVEVLQYDEVRRAQAMGQNNLCRAVAMIVSRYYDDSEEHSKARTVLLASILEQNEAIRAYLRARRAVQDVDPETGMLEPPDDGDADAGDLASPDAADALLTPVPTVPA
jgi:hypothetical protein